MIMKSVNISMRLMLLGMLLLVLSGCDDNGNNAKKTSQSIPIPVKVVSLAKGKLVDSISSTGNLEGSEKAAISPKISGIMEEVLVREGNVLNKGDVLARFDDDDFRLQVKQVEAGLAQAKANFKNAEIELARKEELLKEQAIPQGLYDTFKARYEMAKAQRESAEVTLALAKQNLADTIVRSPISGVVDYRGIEPGEYYMTMSGKPIFRVVTINPIRTKFTLPEKYAGRAKVGQRVKISVDAFPGESFLGEVSVVNPSVDPISRTFNLEALIPNPDHRLKPGFFASVELIFWEKPDVFAVSQAIIGENDGKYYLFVVEDGKAVKREVFLGVKANSYVELVTGVEVGDLIVISGYEGLSDGRTVAIIGE
jgi:membrane fusion protein (multidrug efflux system)